MDNNQNNRDHFVSKWGFILACIGSAVGMGNIWLFPYRTGAMGGAAFLIPYFLFVIIIGYTGVVEEMTFGRAMRTGPLGAFEKASKQRGSDAGKFVGWIPVIGSLGIAIGYTVVVGWILRFTVGSFTGAAVKSADSGAYFGMIAGKFGSLPWHILAIIVVFLVMISGISKGIERVNKFMMPAFFVLFIILAIRVFTLPGSEAGYEFLFKPKWEMLRDPHTWVYALGQAFFSLSLAGSGTVVYGSYLEDKEDILSSAKYVAFFDTVAAMLAAIVIIPAVFAYGVEPSAGPPLMFITMPEVFKAMPGGQIFSIIFFTAVSFAGVTSLINLYETPVEGLQNKFGISRKLSLAIVLGLGLLVGIFIEDGNVLGNWMDVVSIYIIPLGALLAAIMFLWVCKKEFVMSEMSKGRLKPVSEGFYNYSKYVFVSITIIVYILSIFFGGIG
ncbi:MAG: sodium-dependent transporter [Tissierellia bacterium]|nr:sodium-dependent transporter [Tissierellia bacterium]